MKIGALVSQVRDVVTLPRVIGSARKCGALGIDLPPGRAGNTDEGSVEAFPASRETFYVVGQAVAVDGGWTAG